jgi:hypothetical protein
VPLKKKKPIHFSIPRGIPSVMLLMILTLGCDNDGKKQCSWVLEPEPKLMGSTEPPMIPVCARNRQTFKEDCRLQAPLDYAEKVYGRKFRYTGIKVSSAGIPRTIQRIEFCDGKGE